MESTDVRQAMEGFDGRWTDPADYILGITYEIWEDEQVDTLLHYYSDDIPVRSPAGVVVGNQAVIEATRATLHEFPDRRLRGQDVIWSLDPDGGFLSSHRLMSSATHASDGIYGPATGTRLHYRTIADCATRNDTIYDEWVIRDQGAIVRQLGLDPQRYAAESIEREGGPDKAQRPFTPAIDVTGEYRARGNDDEWGQQYEAQLLAAIDGRFDVTDAGYDRALQLETPGGVTLHGRPDACAFWSSLREAFPSADFTVHHRIGRHDDLLSPRAAIRWSLDGRHDGAGAFGEPTGAPVHVMAISHAEFGPWGLRREWVVFDETAIWKQILLHAG